MLVGKNMKRVDTSDTALDRLIDIYVARGMNPGRYDTKTLAFLYELKKMRRTHDDGKISNNNG